MKRLIPFCGICGTLLLTGPRLTAQTTPPAPAPNATPAPATAPVAAPGPAALVELRGRHFDSVAKTEEAMTRRELEAVEALEKERAAKGDYAGAERAARQVDALKKSMEKAGTAKAGVIRLTSQVRHESNYGVEEKNGVFKLAKADGFVRWDVSSIQPGLYEVVLRYTATMSDLLGARTAAQRIAAGYSSGTVGGEVEFSQVSSLSAATKMAQRVTPTETPEKVEALSMGTIDLTSKSATFKVRASAALSDGLMILHGVELVPTAPSRTEAAPAELVKEKTTYRQALTAKVKPLHEAWVKRLLALEKEYAEAGKTEEREATLQEINRMKVHVGAVATAPGSATEKPTQAQAIVLSAADPILATATGEIRMNERKEWLQRLRPVNSRVTFSLDRANPKVPAGSYKVTLAVRTGPTSGGEFQLKCGASALSGTVPASESPTERTLPVEGVLVIGPTDRAIAFVIQSLTTPEGSLCEFRSVTLTPAGRTPKGTGPGSGAEDEAPKAKADL